MDKIRRWESESVLSYFKNGKEKESIPFVLTPVALSRGE